MLYNIFDIWLILDTVGIEGMQGIRWGKRDAI